jgi:putative transposase
MAKKRRGPEQIIPLLREAERKGWSNREFCKRNGVSEQTYCRWKKMYGGLGISEAQRIKQLEKENRRLKQLAGDMALANELLKEELAKRGVN